MYLVTEGSTITSTSWLQRENASGMMTPGCSRDAAASMTPLLPHAAQLEQVVRFGAAAESLPAVAVVVGVARDATRSRVAQALAPADSVRMGEDHDPRPRWCHGGGSGIAERCAHGSRHKV